MELVNLLIPLVVIVLVVLGVFAATGLVIISERQVGVVVKRFSSKSLPPDRLIALNGEAGYQADTLAPGFRIAVLNATKTRRVDQLRRGEKRASTL